MTLTELLTSIYTTKSQLKSKFETILGTSSDALDEYPTLIENYLITYYNNGYKAGYNAATGNTPANPKSLKEYTATIPSWQGQDTNELSTLVNIMSGIADIRVKMRQALGISSNTFSTYPSALDTQASAQYNAGYTAGEQDGTSGTQTKVSTPVFTTFDTNKINISSSDATSIRYWVSNTLGGSAISGTTVTVASGSTNYTVTSTYNGKYLCAIGMASGKTNSDIKSGQMTYTEPSVPVIEVPAAPNWERIPNTNIIHIWSETGTTIYYSLNGGADNYSNHIQGNDGSIVITSNKAAGQIKAYCKNTSTNQVSQTITWPGTFELYVAPSTEPGDPENTPFWIYGYFDNSTASFDIYSTEGTNKIQVSEDTSFNTLLTPTTKTKDSITVDVFTLEKEKYYYIRSYSSSVYNAAPIFRTWEFNTHASYNLGGNLSSLARGNTTMRDSAFKNYFNGTNDYHTDWRHIKDVSNMFFPNGGESTYEGLFDGCLGITSIPATISCTIGSATCRYMFRNCTAITKGPNITASAIGDSGCQSMFHGCTNMTTTGYISATSIGSAGCRSMYESCSSLTSAGNINATSVASQACYNMFYHCTNLVTGPSELKPITLGTECYYQMFDTCSKLVNAPEIKAQVIAYTNCMKWMFWGCNSLKSITVCFAHWNMYTSTPSWCGGSNFSKSGTFTIKGSGTWNTSDYVGNTSGIPSGWTINDLR